VTLAPALAVVGALVGTGLSRWCSQQSYRYPDEQDRPSRRTWWWLVPGMAVAYAALGHRLAGEPVVVVGTYLLAVAVLATLMAVDIDVHRLPDALTLPAYPVFAVLLALCSWASGDWAAYRRALVCGVALFAGYFLLALVSPGGSGLGFGDVKLAGVIGMLVGWFAWPLAVEATFAAFLLGGVVAVVLLLLRRATRTSSIAFGPAMIVGAVLVLVASPGTLAAMLSPSGG
jgi:leader peptidase (prepilin peptidase)/N-methyltransferase